MIIDATAPAGLTAPDVSGAVFDWITFFVPDIDPAAVFRSGQNRAALPSDHNEFVLITPITQTAQGTNVSTYEATGDGGGRQTVGRLMICDVQVDFFSDSDAARQRAELASLWGNDPVGVSYFVERGLSLISCSAPQDQTGTDESNQFVYRYIVTFRVEYWAQSSVFIPGFGTVNIYIENVDVHHPPDKE